MGTYFFKYNDIYKMFYDSEDTKFFPTLSSHNC